MIDLKKSTKNIFTNNKLTTYYKFAKLMNNKPKVYYKIEKLLLIKKQIYGK